MKKTKPKRITVFVLGAPDIEMSEIEDLLVKYKQTYLYACYAGNRCNSGTAYKANFLSTNTGAPNPYFGQWLNVDYVFIECAFFVKGKKFTGYHIDHHNEGDPGYALGAEQYFDASSLGQTLNYLVEKLGISAEITPRMRYVAASDHCPHLAYQGKCRGIDPELLRMLRLEEHCRFNNMTVFDAAIAMNNTIKQLKKSKTQDILGQKVHIINERLSLLKDAAMYLGVAVLSKEQKDDFENMYLFGNTTEHTIRHWLKAMRKHPRYTLSYGVPARGFAGVKLKRSHPVKRGRIIPSFKKS